MSNAPIFSSSADNASMPAATIIPVLYYEDAAVAAAWLQRAFGFTERLRIGTHRIQMNAGSAALVVARGRAPGAESQSSSIMIRVVDADAMAKRVVDAGATLLSEPQTFPYGERQFSATDPEGRVWTFSQSVANVDPATWGGELVAPADKTPV